MIPNGQEGLLCVTEDHLYAQLLVLFPLLNVAWLWNHLKYLTKILRALIHKSQCWFCLHGKEKKKKKSLLMRWRLPWHCWDALFRVGEGTTEAGLRWQLDRARRGAALGERRPAGQVGEQGGRANSGGEGTEPKPSGSAASRAGGRAGGAATAPAGQRAGRPRAPAGLLPARGECGLQVGCAGPGGCRWGVRGCSCRWGVQGCRWGVRGPGAAAESLSACVMEP